MPLTPADLISLLQDARTRAIVAYRASINQTTGVAIDPATGEVLSPDVLADRYLNESLEALARFEERDSDSGTVQ